jgi:hypothetical protein
LPGLDTESNRRPVPPGIFLSSLNFYAVIREEKMDDVAVLSKRYRVPIWFALAFY